MTMSRNYNLIDKLLIGIDDFIKKKETPNLQKRESPAASVNLTEPMNESECQQSGALMRVNHSGEVCAQALYRGQALLEHDAALKKLFEQASVEEADHLAWCQSRVAACGTHTSLLNPFWYAGAFSLAVIVSLFGRGISLGFLEETEKQVYEHLARHLKRLSKKDLESRAVLLQMQADEQKHEHTAHMHGAKPLPEWFKKLMQRFSKIMTEVAYYV